MRVAHEVDVHAELGTPRHALHGGAGKGATLRHTDTRHAPAHREAVQAGHPVVFARQHRARRAVHAGEYALQQGVHREAGPARERHVHVPQQPRLPAEVSQRVLGDRAPAARRLEPVPTAAADFAELHLPEGARQQAGSGVLVRRHQQANRRRPAHGEDRAGEPRQHLLHEQRAAGPLRHENVPQRHLAERQRHAVPLDAAGSVREATIFHQEISRARRHFVLNQAQVLLGAAARRFRVSWLFIERFGRGRVTKFCR